MKTIIQKIGPLYGESVNGSVFGQPNGSLAAPAASVIKLVSSIAGADYLMEVQGSGGNYDLRACKSDGTIVNYAHRFEYNLQSMGYVAIKLYSDSACTAAIGTPWKNLWSYSQGGTIHAAYYATVSSSGTVTPGTKYYARAEAYVSKENNGTGLIAASEVVEVTAV